MHFFFFQLIALKEKKKKFPAIHGAYHLAEKLAFRMWKEKKKKECGKIQDRNVEKHVFKILSISSVQLLSHV